MSNLLTGDCCLIVGLSGGFRNVGRICFLIRKHDDTHWKVRGQSLVNVDDEGEVCVKEKHLKKISGTLPLSSIFYERAVV